MPPAAEGEDPPSFGSQDSSGFARRRPREDGDEEAEENPNRRQRPRGEDVRPDPDPYIVPKSAVSTRPPSRRGAPDGDEERIAATRRIIGQSLGARAREDADAIRSSMARHRSMSYSMNLLVAQSESNVTAKAPPGAPPPKASASSAPQDLGSSIRDHRSEASRWPARYSPNAIPPPPMELAWQGKGKSKNRPSYQRGSVHDTFTNADEGGWGGRYYHRRPRP